MTRAVSRPLLATVAALVALAVYRVDASPEPTPPYGGEYTWESALDEARYELDATLADVRREILDAKATATTAWNNIEMVHARIERLSTDH